MQRVFLSVIFLIFFCAAKSQNRTPVFANREDSAAYFSTEQRLYKAAMNPRYTARIDSLSRVLVGLRAKAVRYRTSYTPNNQYTRYNLRPKDLLSVTKLSLVDYKGSELPDSLFLMTNLKELELINTRIRKLPARLDELKDLTKITLMNNRPTGRLRLGRNTSVKQLGIHDDQHDLRPRSYRNFKALETLDLARNNLTEIPKIRGTKGLKRLWVTDNLLKLEKITPLPSSLEELVLTSNKISSLPSSIGRYTKLKKLNLNANQIETLPKEIGKLQSLEELSLYKNWLTKLPVEIYQLKSLRAIDLYYNRLSELDTAIQNWSRLEILYVSNNDLYTLPANLGSLKNLHELYIHHNRISSIPGSIGNLDSLRVLRANDNLIVEFPGPVLKLKRLENLDFSSNQLTTVPQEVFELPRLQILGLRKNPLDEEIRSRAINWSRKVMSERPVIIHLDGLVEPSDEKEL